MLESLTGFSFPRAPGLCTRYATQITVSRGPQEAVKISIIPRPHADPALKDKLKRFRRRVPAIEGATYAHVFEEVSGNVQPIFDFLTDPDEANAAMGIRKVGETDLDSGLTTFSEDTLKIEITRPSVCYLLCVPHGLLKY